MFERAMSERVVAEREVLLKTGAIEAARSWADACRAELAREGRAIEGGWPGTTSEARMRAGAHIGRVLNDQAMSALTYDELGRVARLTYEEARRSWLGMRNRPAL